MKVLAITAILLVGCATGTPATSDSAAKLSLARAEQDVDRSEQQCIEKVVMRADDKMSNVVMTLGPLTQLQIDGVLRERTNASSQCLVNADKGNAAIAARDRASYENAEALDRKIPLPVLTWSLTP
jgi:hypothetical protein